MSGTSEDMEQRIRERAHALWEKEGCPDGRTDEFWHRAASEVQAEIAAPHAPVAPTPAGEGVDLHSDQSFPASDPPPHNVIVGPST